MLEGVHHLYKVHDLSFLFDLLKKSDLKAICRILQESDPKNEPLSSNYENDEMIPEFGFEKTSCNSNSLFDFQKFQNSGCIKKQDIREFTRSLDPFLARAFSSSAKRV